MIEIFLSRVGSIRIKQREKVNNKNGQNLALCRTSNSGFYIQAYTLGDLEEKGSIYRSQGYSAAMEQNGLLE